MEGNWYDHKLYQSKNYLERYFRMWRMDFRMGEKIEERSLQNLNHLLPTSSKDCSSLMRNDQTSDTTITRKKIIKIGNKKIIRTAKTSIKIVNGTETNTKYTASWFLEKYNLKSNAESTSLSKIIITEKAVAGRNDQRSKQRRLSSRKACWKPWWKRNAKHEKRRGLMKRNRLKNKPCLKRE